MDDRNGIGRLEKGLRGVLAGWGLSATTDLTLLGVSRNVTFLASDPQSGRDVVLRVHPPGQDSLAEIASELAWIAALKSADIVETPAPVLQQNGDLIVDIDDAGAVRHVVAFKVMPGREADEQSAPPGLFRDLGAVAARLHAHSRAWTPPRGFTRKSWTFDAMLGPHAHWGDWRDALGLTSEGRQVLSRTADLLRERLLDYGQDDHRFGLVHADLQPANLRVDGERLAVVNFDACGFGWYLCDFAAAISFREHEPDVPDLLDAWLDGYRTVAPISDDEAAILPVFIMLRRMQLTAWIASHPDAQTARDLGEGYTHGTVALARAFLAEYAEAAAEAESANS